MKETEAHYQRALSILQQGNWIEAFQIFWDLVGEDPLFIPAYRELAYICWDRGHYDFAQQVLETALEFAPSDHESHLLLGNVLYLKGHYRKALACYVKARRAEEEEPELAYNMGLCYNQLGDRDRAVAHFDLAVCLAPDMVEALLALGACYLDMGELEDAEKRLWSVLALDSSNAEAYHLLGVVSSQRERWDEALSFWERALTLEPHRPETLRKMGWIYRSMGERGLSTECLELCIRLQPRHIQARLDVSLVYMEKMEFERAAEHLRAVIALEPDNRLALDYLREAERMSREMRKGV